MSLNNALFQIKGTCNNILMFNYRMIDFLVKLSSLLDMYRITFTSEVMNMRFATEFPAAREHFGETELSFPV